MGSISNNNAGLLFVLQAKDEASPVVRKASKEITDDISKFSSTGASELDKIINSTGGLSAVFGSLANPAALAATAITGITSAAVAAGTAIFNIAEQASEFGSEINDASEKTGIGAETLSALKFAADQSGSSFKEVTTGIRLFTKTIGEAAQGNQKAKDTLQNLGIDGKKAINDLDGAFAQAVKRIGELPPGVQQTKAAIDAFGRSGSNLIPVINTMDSNVAEFIEKARKLGVVLTQEDVKAADNFGDTLDTLKAQAAGVSFQFAKEFLPILTTGMRDLSKFFADNKESVKSWGITVANVVSGVIQAFKEVVAFYDAHPILSRVILGVATAGLSEGVINFVQNANQIGSNTPSAIPNEIPDNKPKIPTDNSGYLQDLEDQRKEEEKRRKEREALEKAELAGQIALLKSHLADAGKIYDQTISVIRGKLKDTGDIDAFTAASDASIQSYANEVNAILPKLIELEKNQALEQKKAASERQLVFEEQGRREQDIQQKINNEVNENEKLRTETTKKEAEKRVKISEDEAKRRIEVENSSAETAIAERALALKNGQITDLQYVRSINEIKINALLKEKQSLESVAKTDENRAEITQKIKLLDEEVARARVSYASDVVDAINRESEAEKKRLDALNAIFKDLNFVIGGLGAKSDLEELNELLADPEITKAIEERAKALGYTVEQLKEIIRLKAENDADPRSTGTRERVVPEEKSGAQTTVENIFGMSDEKIAKVQNQAGVLKGVFGDLGASVQSMAGNMLGAFGSAIEGFLLYGDSIGTALKKAAAAELAHFAAVSAIKALFYTAEGIVALFFNPGASAAYFKAAAIYAAVAVAAGVGAKALAGDSFKQKSSASNSFSNATGQSSQNQSSQNQAGGGGSGQGGQAYSSKPETNLREEDRQRTIATQSKQVIEIKLTHDFDPNKGNLIRTIADNIKTYGDMHDAVKFVVVNN